MKNCLYSMAMLAALLVGPAAAQPPSDVTKAVDSVLSNDRFKKAIGHVSSEYERIVGEIIKLTEIPAPPFQEAARAQAFRGCCRRAGSRTP
jgi:tripeptide aminopeptidase